jgi:hypothetical protein
MAAGLGYKDFVTGEVLTAGDVDGYLMQGLWVFANATARDAAVTSPQEGNACYLKDTDVIQVYSGSAWATQSASNPISANIVDAKGDLIAGTAADTVGRLGVGSNGQVLAANSSAATGLEWVTASGGALILLNTGSFTTSSQVSLPDNTFTSTYRNYRLIVNFTCTASNYFTLRLRAGGSDDTNNNYSSTYAYFYYGSNGISADDRAPSATSWSRMGYTETSNQHNGVYDIFQPQEAKSTNISGLYNRAAVGCSTCFGIKDATTQFDSLSLIPGGGTITGNYSIYGYTK